MKPSEKNLTPQLRTFENPIGVGTTVIRMKGCRMRNESRCRRLSLFRPAGVRSRASSLSARLFPRPRAD